MNNVAPGRIAADNRPQATVFLVDDDAGVRDAFSMLLELSGFDVECFPSASAFLEQYKDGRPGCLVLDLSMPGMSGLELQAALTERRVQLPIIIVTAHGDVASARASLKAGAFDFLEKPVYDDVLLAAVRSALELDRTVRERVAEQAAIDLGITSLSAREREVLDRVIAGKHNREIAAELDLSTRTVEIYKARMMQKMDVKRIPDLVRRVLRASAQRD